MGGAGAYPTWLGWGAESPWRSPQSSQGRIEDRKPFTPMGHLDYPSSCTPVCMLLDCGMTLEHPDRTHAGTGRTWKFHSPGDSNREPSYWEVNHCTAMPPQYSYIYFLQHLFCLILLYVSALQSQQVPEAAQDHRAGQGATPSDVQVGVALILLNTLN